MSSSPHRAELGVRGTSVLSHTWSNIGIKEMKEQLFNLALLMFKSRPHVQERMLHVNNLQFNG